MTGTNATAISQLTEQQKGCLRLVGKGLTSKEIALRIDPPLSPSTVDQYIHRATLALGASNRREAARMLVQAEFEEGTDDGLKEFELKPQPLFEPAFDVMKGVPVTSRQDSRPKAAVRRALGQFGGSTHGLNRWQVLISIFRVALWAGGSLAALVATGYWLNHLFA